MTMPMPCLTDVREAAENILLDDHATHMQALVERDAMEECEWLARFAFAVLDAPGMSAERLAECQKPVNIELDYKGDEQENWGVLRIGGRSFITPDDIHIDDAQIVQDVVSQRDELLAEVLRLRAR